MDQTLITLSFAPPTDTFDPTLIDQITTFLHTLGIADITSHVSTTNAGQVATSAELDALPAALRNRLLKMEQSAQPQGYELLTHSIAPAPNPSDKPVQTVQRTPFPNAEQALAHGETLLDKPLSIVKIEVAYNGQIVASKETARHQFELEYTHPTTGQLARISNLPSISAVLRQRTQLDEAHQQVIAYTVRQIRSDRTVKNLGTMQG